MPDDEVGGPGGGHLVHEGARFVRCLLPVRLTGGVELVIHDPLPVAVRATLGDVWTVERSAGLRFHVEERTTCFSGDGR